MLLQWQACLEAHTLTGSAFCKGPCWAIVSNSSEPRSMDHCQSEGLVEIVRHVLFDCFSQKTGLLDHMEGIQDWPVEEALSFAKMDLNCSELLEVVKGERHQLTSLQLLPGIGRNSTS